MEGSISYIGEKEMKILEKIDSIFNTKQRIYLENLLYKKIGEGVIHWKDVFTEQFNKRIAQLENGLKLNKIPGFSKINVQKTAEQMEDIELTLASLKAQSEDISNILNRHEMFRKDNAKTFFNIAQDFKDMVTNEIKDYRTNNVTVQNGVIELIPTQIQDFEIKTVDVEYFPDNYIDRSGNDPTSANVSPGTESDYWLVETITSAKSKVGATITIGFNGNINFNVLQIATAGKYVNRVETVEIQRGSIWESVNFSGESIGKNIELSILDEYDQPITYTTEYIRLTIVQDKPDYMWSKTIDNEREVLSYPDDEKSNIIRDYIYHDTMDLTRSSTLHNVFSYIFGLYFVRVLLRSYSGSAEGNFYSRKITADQSFRFVQINTTEDKTDPFTVEYKIIQHDGAYANISSNSGNIDPNVKLALLDTYSASSSYSGISGNKIPLAHYPIADGFSCKLNGAPVRLVTEFEYINDSQVMFIGNNIYFNKPIVSSDTVNVEYQHYTDYVIIQIILKTNTVYQSLSAPKILGFDVELS